jgi:hypothetical protein
VGAHYHAEENIGLHLPSPAFTCLHLSIGANAALIDNGTDDVAMVDYLKRLADGEFFLG